MRSMPHAAGVLAGLVVSALSLAACSGSSPAPSASSPGSNPASSAVSAVSAAGASPPTRAELPRAPAVAQPETGSCHQVTYAAAIAPTAGRSGLDCARAHTALTFAVGQLDTVEQGHLLAVDSAAVRDQAAQRCPAALPGFLGGTTEALRLSMLRTVWFTPTVAQSDTGAQWYRCDVVALGADEELADLGGDLQGVLGRDEAAAYAMCGTAAPDAADFQRVICGRTHSWRAISVIDLGTGDYPGEAAARAAGQTPCQDAGREVAADSLDFQWGYEYPTAAQWQAGQTFGRCWAPD